VELVELDMVTDQQWAEIVAGEVEPWGLGEELSWRDKEHQIAVRGLDGRLLALAGTAIADVEVEGSGPFQVLGIGGVFVTPSQRGRGLAVRLVRELLAGARRDPSHPDRAMLFCRPQLIGLYRKLGFREIDAPVWAEQPRGRIEVPLRAMWHPLAKEAEWPAGRVDVRGLPF
jgi:GNAT superfamily N-acetyltransferase